MTAEEMVRTRVARFVDRRGDWDAFADARVEGYRRAQHRFIGSGASGKADTAVIPAEHFTLSVMFVPVGQGNAAHTHEVEEVFFILQGKVMVFFEDEAGQRAEATLGAWDCVSCPAGVVHGFQNVGLEPAYLQVMLGKARPDLMTYQDATLQGQRDAHLVSPRLMRAQVLHAWGDALAWETVATPAPGRGEVLIRVEACGVGLTVLNYMNGNMDRRPELLPRIPGHEFVGTVAEVGPEVDTVRVGQRVMSYFYLACGHCDYCRLAHEPLCRNLRGNVGVVTNGGYAEYAVLPAFNCLPVPERLTPVEATAVIDAIATPLHVSRRAAIGPTDVVLVIGAAGGVGIHMVQMARLCGATVVAVDVDAAKLKATREHGAVAAIDFAAPDARDALRAAAPDGATVAVDLVGRAETLAFCLDGLDRRGRLVTLTTFPGVTLSAQPRQLVRDEVSVLGSRYASRWEVTHAATLVAEGKIRPVVSAVLPLERVGEINAKLRARTLLGRGAVTC